MPSVLVPPKNRKRPYFLSIMPGKNRDAKAPGRARLASVSHSQSIAVQSFKGFSRNGPKAQTTISGSFPISSRRKSMA